MNSIKKIKAARNEYLMQTWRMLFGEQTGTTPFRKLSGVKKTLSDYMTWLACLPEILKLVPVLCGKTRHSAVLVGVLTDNYPEYPVWLRKCWGIAIVLNIINEEDEERINGIFRDTMCDTVLIIDDAPCCAVEKCARENGLNVIYIEQSTARGKYLMRRDMRKSINNYMSIMLGEEPLRAELKNADRVI